MKTGTLVKLKSDLYTSGDQPVTLDSVGIVVEVEKLPGQSRWLLEGTRVGLAADLEANYYVRVKWAGIECPIRQESLFAYHDTDLDVLAEA
jgi:hypothetical protein